MCTSGRRGSGKERGKKRRGGRREEGREGRRGDIPPSGADDCLTSVRAHADVIFYYSAIRNDVILHIYNNSSCGIMEEGRLVNMH